MPVTLTQLQHGVNSAGDAARRREAWPGDEEQKPAWWDGRRQRCSSPWEQYECIREIGSGGTARSVLTGCQSSRHASHPSIYLSIYPSIHPSIHPSMHTFLYKSSCQSMVLLCVCVCVCVHFFCLPVHTHSRLQLLPCACVHPPLAHQSAACQGERNGPGARDEAGASAGRG